MKRLVYSPEINVWIKSNSGIFDLSPYITSFNIHRTINQASTANLFFRNPKVSDGEDQPRFLFTQHKTGDQYGPMFHPMDPIIISLTRIKGYPVQVFTGYCDTTPYFQMYPGIANLTASCTLKRLLYTYWDPGLPFVLKYLSSKGWALQNGSAINLDVEANRNNDPLNDSSLGNLLFSVLKDVGGWEEEDIFIQDLPNDQITSIVEGLYEDLIGEAKASFEDMEEFLSKTIAADNNLGGSSSTSTTPDGTIPETGGPVKNEKEIVNTIRSVAQSYGLPPEFILAIAIIETSLKGDTVRDDYIGWYQWKTGTGGGYDGIPPSLFNLDKATDLRYSTDVICQAAKYLEAQFKPKGLTTWAQRLQLGINYTKWISGNELYTESRFNGMVNLAKQKLEQYK